METQYDIFLSYRREGGDAAAMLVKKYLTDKGYSVFLDTEDLHSGTFNTKLYDVIDSCNDFILICSINSLDRCANDGDWVRIEIARAIQMQKNIVPIWLCGFDGYPEELPPDIDGIRSYNAVDNSKPEYTDAAMARLTDKFLTSAARQHGITPGCETASTQTGYGTHTFINGEVYEGEFKDGVPSGRGKYTYINGDVYEGAFENGKPSGRGKCAYDNGDVYIGEFKDGKENGRGKYTFANGDFYDGGFRDGKKYGTGRMIYANGDVYEGKFKYDRRNGQGKLVYANGGIYEGMFKYDKENGLGRYTSVLGGGVYEGEFKEGKRADGGEL